jgi:hypothetical protein
MLDDQDLLDASGWLADTADRIRSEITDTEAQLQVASGGTGTRLAREYGLELLRLRLRLLDRVLASAPGATSASATAG